MAKVAEAFVEIRAKTDKLRRGLRQATGMVRRQIGRMQKAVKGIGTAFVAAAAAIRRAWLPITILLGAVTLGIGRTLRRLDDLAKTARRLGVDPGDLQRFRFAAGRAGVQNQQFDIGLQRLARRVSEAAQGGGEAVAALQELGLDAGALTQLPITEQLREVLRALEQIPNETDRIRLAFKLFDSEGVAIKNLVGNLDDSIARFDELRGAVNDTDLSRIEQANDALGEIRVALQGLTDEILINFAPAITEIATALANALSKFRRFIDEFAAGLLVLQSQVDILLFGSSTERERELDARLRALGDLMAGDTGSGRRSGEAPAMPPGGAGNLVGMVARGVVQSVDTAIGAFRTGQRTPFERETNNQLTQITRAAEQTARNTEAFGEVLT